MELKEYQEGVLRRFDDFLDTLARKKQDAEDFFDFQMSRGNEAQLADYCQEAWAQLTNERVLPMIRDKEGRESVAPYVRHPDGYGRNIPSVCLKVPTGGGKTLLATACLERIQTDYLRRQNGFVLWVVPSDAIYKQTWKQLADREHPYRQMLERASGGRVKMLEKGDAFTQRDVNEYLCVMLLMLPSAARTSKETLRMFRDSGRFSDFFPVEDDNEKVLEVLRAVPNLEANDLSDLSYADGVVPGSASVKHSLGNVLRLVRPVIILDEGHRAYSNTARDTLNGFNPRFILELSATPNASKHQSNVLVNVPGTDLKNAQMIKLPINIYNEAKGTWKPTLTEAHAMLGKLAKEAHKVESAEGRYIRPIMLIRVERTGEKQRESGLIHAEDVREYLIKNLGVKEEEIRLKTSEKDELGTEDLLADTCPVRFIITKDALREGWDCPFAYVLTILSKTTAKTALTQMIGRVLRQPHAHATSRAALNESYVYTFDQDVNEAVESVKRGLSDEGMTDLAADVRALDASGQSKTTRRETVKRRKGLTQRVFLPRVLHKDKSAPEGYRELDYERDVLGGLDWESLAAPEEILLPAMSDLIRTHATIDLDTNRQLTTDQMAERMGEVPEGGLDLPFLARQLMDVVPNPWQGMRLLEGALERLRKKYDEKHLYLGRLDLLKKLKTHLEVQVAEKSEALFREKLEDGEISLRLAASKLSLELEQSIEVEVGENEPILRRKNGDPLEKSLYEPIFVRDFNNFEKDTALYLDEAKVVHWWHRVAVGRGSYGLQGWQRQRVYPDFLVSVRDLGDGKYRFSLLETKGDHLAGNDDTEYKRRLFALLTQAYDNTAPIGELDLEGTPESMHFQMLMEKDWKGSLVGDGIE